MKRMINLVDDDERTIILELGFKLFSMDGFTYDIPTGNGEIRKIAMYQFAELHWLWERYSNERLASFLILDDYTFNNFIKWLKG